MFFPSTWIPEYGYAYGSSLVYTCDCCGKPSTSLTWVSTFPTGQVQPYYTKLCQECLAKRQGDTEDERLIKDIRDAIDRYIQAKMLKGATAHVPTWWPYPYNMSTTSGPSVESRI